jgi:hypothetical protein
MNSMENFFNWMSKPVPEEDIIVWFNIHNMNYEKIELYGDIFKTLNQIVIDTYLGDESKETKISMSNEEKESHFEWCWKKMVETFLKENVKILLEGTHKDYFKDFYLDTFYNPSEKNINEAIPNFISDVFDIDKSFTKSDLDVLTELYKLLEKNIE